MCETGATPVWSTNHNPLLQETDNSSLLVVRTPTIEPARDGAPALPLGGGSKIFDWLIVSPESPEN